MSYTRALRVLTAVMIVSALMPLAPASAARNTPPRIVKAEMKDADRDGLADRIILTYNEKIRHKLDTSRFPFVVQGYRIARINAVRGSLKLGILLKENQSAPLKPASIKYNTTRQQPVQDLKRKQARKQLFTKILGLTVTPPPPPPGDEFLLTVAKTGDGTGAVSDDRSKINCGATCSASYPAGTTVTLTAAPDAATKAQFGGWTGCASSTESCTITMDSDKTVGAAFNKAGSASLSVVKAGTGSGVVRSTSTPAQAAQIDCGATCSASYPTSPPTTVTLTATPDAASKSVIAGWSGGGCTGTGNTCNVTVDAAKTVTVTFNLPAQHRLTVIKSGSPADGTVTSSSTPQINCGATCEATYPDKTVVTLTATANDTSEFAGWEGGGCTGTQSTCNVTMDAAKTVTAIFKEKTTGGTPTVYKIALTKTGPGQVTCVVGTTPTPCDGNFAPGSQVILTAAPDVGNKVTWGGDCTSFLNLLTCTLTMNADKTVGATFTSLLP